MLPPKRLSSEERKWLEVFGRLGSAERNCLLSYAEFLLNRQGREASAAAEPIPLPLPIERPSEERVIAAIKRLSNTYFMLDAGRLLHETSALVTAHILQGRAAAEVIDDLERLFHDHYRSFVAEREALGERPKASDSP